MYRIIGGDQKEYGPATAQEMQHWIAEGRLSRQSLVLADGSTEWKPLETFPEFSEALGNQGTYSNSSDASGPPGNPQAWATEVLARPPVLEVGRCLAQSWDLVAANFGVLVGACCLAWTLGLVCQFLPLVGGIVYWLLRGVIFGGLYLVFLRRIRGQPASPGDMFSTFGANFTQLMLVGFLTAMLTYVATLASFCILFLPGLYLCVAWILSIPLVADRRLEFWSAMELSRQVITRVWFNMFLLVVLAFLPVILTFIFVQVKMAFMAYPAMHALFGSSQPDIKRVIDLSLELAKSSLPLMLLLKFVFLLNLPFATGALMFAYENLFGSRPAPRP